MFVLSLDDPFLVLLDQFLRSPDLLRLHTPIIIGQLHRFQPVLQHAIAFTHVNMPWFPVLIAEKVERISFNVWFDRLGAIEVSKNTDALQLPPPTNPSYNSNKNSTRFASLANGCDR